MDKKNGEWECFETLFGVSCAVKYTHTHTHRHTHTHDASSISVNIVKGWAGGDCKALYS
jgi:hypothetical protein